MQLSGRFLRMYRLCGGGGVAGGGPKPQMGVPFPHCPPSALYHQLGHAPVHRAPPQTRKKTWSFIQDLSYDTFFTMKRLLERSQRPDEVLRWISQNPSKVSQSHLAVALQRIAQLLPAPPPAVEAPPSCAETTPTASEAPPPVSEGGGAKGRKQTLEHQDFLSLCDTIVRDCGKFDNFSLVTSLYAAATLGLSPDSSLVMALESECERRVSQFNQKDLSMVFSSREAPPPGVALTEACLSGLERSLERERHPQTLFLLLAYYRGRWRELHSQSEHSNKDTSTAGANPELLLTNRKILRVVKHTLSCVSTVRDQEMALLDEMLAACAAEASNRSLELIFSSHLFHQSRQERFITRLAEELPKKADSLSPNTMALIAKYAARHRLRETRLLDTVAEYLLKRAEQLDTKVIQRLVFPLSRMNYRPQNALELFERLEQVLEPKALSSPLATVNILMSLLQLRYCPPSLLREVFCPGFIHSLTNSPYLGIVRRYLSLLDSAVDLEFEEYSGPRLNPAHKVLMFDHALTADEVNRKYSYKGLVAEALRQLIGEQSYKQDQILPPGYYTDFLLWIDSSRRVVPIRSVKPCDPSAWQLDSSGLIPDFQKFSLEAEPSEDALPVVGGTCLHHMTPFYSADYYPAPSKDQEIHRVVLSVNDKWHYCHNSQVLVGSRAMRDRHLRLLGYLLLQLPYHELEKLNGIEEVKGYLQQKLTDLPLTGPHLPL
ncbi:hypothetical protein NQD34_013181 [Periophthalmus magnuspinnatus]|nr:hypothetical protein NQD34_013181 [Periophthalmus magnuspinnatus]